jgi:hypothetical protein
MFLMPRVASATAMPDLRGEPSLPLSLIAVSVALRHLRCGRLPPARIVGGCRPERIDVEPL